MLIGRLDAGQNTREAYRLSDDGTLSRAIWNDNNQILNLYESVYIGESAYSDAVQTLLAVEEKQRIPSNDGLIQSPSVLTVEIAIVRQQQPVDFTFRNEPSNDLDRLLFDWEQQIQMTEPVQGSYVWTMPGPAEAGDADISISRPDCESGIAKAVEDGVLGPDVVIGASEGVAQYLENGRSRYIARSANGFVYFGFLSAP